MKTERMNWRRMTTILAAAAALGMAGCTTPPTAQQMGVASGAVLGGVAGGVLFGGAAATVGGAAVGALVGNEIGKRQ